MCFLGRNSCTNSPCAHSCIPLTVGHQCRCNQGYQLVNGTKCTGYHNPNRNLFIHKKQNIIQYSKVDGCIVWNAHNYEYSARSAWLSVRLSKWATGQIVRCLPDKNFDYSSPLSRSRPKSARISPDSELNSAPDFIQIGSLLGGVIDEHVNTFKTGKVNPIRIKPSFEPNTIKMFPLK